MKIDLSGEVTVFVISCGKNPNIDLVKNALAEQTACFLLDEIIDYRPLSAAFQQMIDRCKTKYYIEVDDDMVLNNDAVEFMYNTIRELSNLTAMVSFRLHDVHINEDIYGIKIYNHEITKKYNYNLQHPSCEVEQMDRMKASGYVASLSPSIIGRHSPLWDNRLIHERYRNLMHKFLLYRYAWLEFLPGKLFDIFNKEPTELNLYAILGCYSALLENNEMTEEKNFSVLRKEFSVVKSYINGPVQSTIYVTGKCNHNCSFCLRQYHQSPVAKDMNLDTISFLMRRLPSLKALCFCGFGEPFMNKDLFILIDRAREFGKFVGMITNGSLIKKRFEELVNHPPDYLSVSLNAHDKESHRAAVGADTWDDTISGIEMLTSRKPFPLYISTVVTKKNIESVKKTVRLAHSLGIGKVHLHNLLPHFSDSQNGSFWENVLTLEDKAIVDDFKSMPEAHIIDRYPILIDKNGGNKACEFPWRSIAVDGDGNISLCNSVLPCDPKYGNIREFVVWNNEKCEQFRNNYVSGNIPQCSMCFRNWDCS